MSVAGAWTEAGWPAPPGIRGGTSLRGGDGLSPAPFDRLNLGLRCGDALDAALANRAELPEIGGLPSAPVWLRQVHGAGVVRFGENAGELAGSATRAIGITAPAAEATPAARALPTARGPA